MSDENKAVKVAIIRKLKGDANCSCAPQELKICMLHLPLDDYIIWQALRRESEGD